MSGDTVYKQVGTISSSNNRIFWIVPKHIYLIKRCWFESPPFNLIGKTWQLRFYLRWNNAFSYKERLRISIKLLSVLSECETLKVQLGISGKNVETCETFETEDYALSSDPPIRSFDIDNIDQKWDSDGYIRLFAAIGKLNENSKAHTSNANKGKTAEKKVDAQKDTNDSNEDKEMPIKDVTGAKILQDDLKNIFINGNFSDVVLKVGDQEFKCHRCILGARSPVFFAMLVHDTTENATGVVDIRDVDPDIFSIFLKYLYTGRVNNIAPQNAPDVYTVADRYQVYELKKVCMRHMLKNISVDNFCHLLTLSILHDENDLTDACNDFFMKHSLDIVKTTNWKVFLSENPEVGNDLYVKQLQMAK